MLNELNNNFVIECNWIYVADVNKYIREKKINRSKWRNTEFVNFAY